MQDSMSLQPRNYLVEVQEEPHEEYLHDKSLWHRTLTFQVELQLYTLNYAQQALRPMMPVEAKLECSLDFGILQSLFLTEHPTVNFDASIFCTFWGNQVLFFHKATCVPHAASVLQLDINNKIFPYYGLIFSPLFYNSQFLFPQIQMNTNKESLNGQ